MENVTRLGMTWISGLWLMMGLLAGRYLLQTPAAVTPVAAAAPAVALGDEDVLVLSEQARATLKLRTGMVAKETFRRSISVPGMITVQPGRSRRMVTTHLEGLVSRVAVREGEAVSAGVPLFDLRITQDHLLESQTELLSLVEDLDVVNREIERVRPLVESGSSPVKSLLDQTYQQQKILAAMKVHREALALHEFSPEQIERIVKGRQLVSEMKEVSPPGEVNGVPPLFVVERLTINPGTYVAPGDALMELLDYSQLTVEGNAFEQDLASISQSLARKWPIEVTLEGVDAATPPLALPILYVGDSIDPVSRTVHFYMLLTNELTRDEMRDGKRYVNWKYKPGQRLRLRVPVEEWSDRIVLPATALAQDGAETYVFRQSRANLKRRRVTVEYRDPERVVLADDGAIVAGNTVALNGAQQLLVALKNQVSGGAGDHHHGHEH